MEEKLTKCKKDAFRLLAFRARSTEELRSRLVRKGHDKGDIETLIASFTKEGLLDDEKFANSWNSNP